MKSKIVRLKAGQHSYVFCPVWVKLDEDVTELQNVALVDQDTGKVIPCQVEQIPEAKGTKLWWMIDSLTQGQEKSYELVKNKQVPAIGKVDLNQGDDRIEIKIGAEFFTNYYFGPKYPKPFLHPLIGPYGKSVTRDYPIIPDIAGETTDHPHHRSVWTGWGEVNGEDFWCNEPEGGVIQRPIRHKQFLTCSGGMVFGHIISINEWIGSTGEKIVEERREVRIYNLPSSIRVVDWETNLRSLGEKVLLGDTKEGGFLSIRVATTMDGDKGGRIENSYGAVSEAETWGKRAHWCDYSGPVDDKIVGIAIFDNPENFRYPTYWHVRDYGLFAANPLGLSHFEKDKSYNGSYEIPAGGQVSWKYRIYIHGGNAVEGNVGEKFNNYVNPPVIELIEE